MTIEHYEQLAKQFQRDTGLLAPGKDVPAAAANDPQYSLTHRQQTWYKWFTTQRDKAVPGHDMASRQQEWDKWVASHKFCQRCGLAIEHDAPQDANICGSCAEAESDNAFFIRKVKEDLFAIMDAPQEEADRQAYEEELASEHLDRPPEYFWP